MKADMSIYGGVQKGIEIVGGKRFEIAGTDELSSLTEEQKSSENLEQSNTKWVQVMRILMQIIILYLLII